MTPAAGLDLMRQGLITALVMAAAVLGGGAACAEGGLERGEDEGSVLDAGPEDAVAAPDGEEAEPDAPAADAGRPRPARPKRTGARVARVVDGDTIELRNGATVRLVQIDAPEAAGECYGAEASAVLRSLLPPGTRVRLERDPALDDVDRYGRILRTVLRGRTNVNLALVRRGAASVWFYDGDRGRYAGRLLAAARRAQAERRGAWGACRATLDPGRAFDTEPRGPSAGAAAGAGSGPGCAAGYTPCLPVGSDLDCADVRRLGRAPVRVTGDDPYRLDGDGDGWGCD